MSVAIYTKNMEVEQIADLRAWVVGQGFTEIIEYQDVTLLEDVQVTKNSGACFRIQGTLNSISFLLIHLRNQALLAQPPPTF